MYDKTAPKGHRSIPLTPGKSSEPHLLLQDIKILVVEDEFILGLDLQDFLESQGAIVIGPAATIEQALGLAKTERFCCSILDVHVAGKNIFPVAKLLSEKRIPFLFHTGHGDAHTLSRDWPGSEVLIKPAPYDRLVSTLVNMTERAVPFRH